MLFLNQIDQLKFSALLRVSCIAYAILLSGCATIDHDDGVKVGFLAFGDSGYITDRPNGSGLVPVATAMRHFCDTAQCDFATMAGDNIYPSGADGDPQSDADARRFQTVFLNPYGTLPEGDEDFSLYVTLGNHDWLTSRAGAFAQIKFHEETPPFYMDGPFYSVQPPSAGGAVEIFVIDTEMLLSAQLLDQTTMNDDGSMISTGRQRPGGTKNALPQNDYERNQLAWLLQALQTSSAQWKLVLAHHPLWESNSSKYAQSVALRSLLLPVLCQYADAYIAGHQHTLELHEESCETVSKETNVLPLPHLVSGAAAKARPINANFMRWQHDRFPQLKTLWAEGDAWGFAHIRIDGNNMLIRIISTDEGQQKAEEFTEVFSYSFTNRSGVHP